MCHIVHPKGNPLIYPQSQRIIAFTDGNGAAAKSADELGRLATEVVLHGQLISEGYDTNFHP